MAKTKYSYESLRSYFQSLDYVLLTSRESYKNVGTPLEVMCPKGHVYITRWSNFFSKGNRCKKCTSCGIDFVIASLKKEGYTTLSTSYKNQYSKIKYRCPLGHTAITTWNNWRQGCRCPECLKESFSNIYIYFLEHGYTITSLEEEYTNSKFKFVYTCPRGHTSSMNWDNFKAGYRCPFCSVGNVSLVSQKWLDQQGILFVYREYKIRAGSRFFRVYGYDPKTNIVYEFLGDYWHGNPSVYNPDLINKHTGKKFSLLYEEWLEKKRLLENLGYTVIYIWESCFIH